MTPTARMPKMNNVVDFASYARRKGKAPSPLRLASLSQDTEIDLLNEALTIKIICCFRYRRNYLDAMLIDKFDVSQEFLKFAHREVCHARRLADCIVALAGRPVCPDEEAVLEHQTRITQTSDLLKILEENLVAKEIVVDTYLTLLDFIKDTDQTTANVLKDIIADEEQHSEELMMLLERVKAKDSIKQSHLRVCR